mgnify:FL=1
MHSAAARCRRPLAAPPLQAEPEILPFSRLIVIFGIMVVIFGDPELAPVFFHETIHSGIFPWGRSVDTCRHARALRDANQTVRNILMPGGRDGAVASGRLFLQGVCHRACGLDSRHRQGLRAVRRWFSVSNWEAPYLKLGNRGDDYRWRDPMAAGISRRVPSERGGDPARSVLAGSLQETR